MNLPPAARRIATALLAALALASQVPGTGSAQTPAPAPSTAAAPAAPAATPGPPLAEDATITKRARAEFLTWQTGKLDRTQYSKRLSEALTDIMVDQIVEAIKGLGDLKDFEFKAGQSINGDRVYRYLVSCSSGSIAMIYAVGPDGKVDGLFFRPA